MNTDLNVIVNEWAYRVHDGKPNPKESAHLYQLSEVLIEQGWPLGEIDKLLQNLREAKGDTSATTFYHEVITGILVGGGNSSFNDGTEVGKFFKNKTIRAVNASLSTVKLEGAVWERFLLKASIPKGSIVSDAKTLSSRIIKELGKGKNMMWTGPTNDGSKFGAADIAGTFSGYGDVGISLKAGVGQLKNLTLGTFTKILGMPELKGADFLKKYNSNFNSMTKDWMKLVEGLFNKLTKDTTVKKIFKKHIKKLWDTYQKEILTEDELNTLTDAVGLNRIKYSAKTKKFKYFCRKIQEKNHPQWKEWQKLRGKHFNDILSGILTIYSSFTGSVSDHTPSAPIVNNKYSFLDGSISTIEIYL